MINRWVFHRLRASKRQILKIVNSRGRPLTLKSWVRSRQPSILFLEEMGSYFFATNLVRQRMALLGCFS